MPNIRQLLFIGALFILFPAPLFAYETHTVRITYGAFVPESIEINPGDTVVFVNVDSKPHWPASNLHPTHTSYPGSDIRACGTEKESSAFDACRGLEEGEEFKFTFSSAGTWRFHDHLYPEMGGVVVVRGESAAVEKPSSELRITERFAAKLLHFWYSLNPKQAERKLEKLDVAKITHDDQELEFWMRVFGHELLFEALIEDTPPLEFKTFGKDGLCHTEAHYLGRMAYNIGIFTVEDEHHMDTRCQFGFYHGVIESSFGNLGSDSTIKEMGKQCAQQHITRRINCSHIIGHGVMLSVNYDLPAAIEKCHALVEDKTGKDMCYHGAFMENVFAALNINVLDGHKTTWIDPERPNFPCDSSELPAYPGVNEQCYFNQALVWSENPLTDFNDSKAFDHCSRVDPAIQYMCNAGIGFGLVLFPKVSDEEVVERCNNAPHSEARKSCLIAAVFLRNSPIYQTHGFRNKTFCTALDQPDLVRCGRYVDRVVAWLIRPEEE